MRPSQPLLLAPEDVAALIGTRPVIVVGSGAARRSPTPSVAAGGQAEARLADLQPHARSLALLAADLAPAQPLAAALSAAARRQAAGRQVLARAVAP